jgi:hypothetical protein
VETLTGSGAAGGRTPLAADDEDDAGTLRAQSPTCNLNEAAVDESPPREQN